MSALTILECSESQKSAILDIFGRTVHNLHHDVDNIRKWMEKQPHLPEIADDKVIESFLLITKFRVEETKKKLDMYYTVRSIIPEFFDKNPNDSVIQNVMNTVYFMPLPKLTKELLRVVIVKMKNSNTDFDAVAYVAHTLNIAEIRLRDECSLGEVQFYDLTGLKINIFAKFTPSIIKKGNFVLEKVFSSRPQGIHFINTSSFMDSFITLVKSVLNDKLSQRVYSHKDMESLYKLVPKNILPADYGGEEKSLEVLSDQWKKRFLECDDLFQHLRKLQVDEQFRRKEKTLDDELHGHFRKLTID